MTDISNLLLDAAERIFADLASTDSINACEQGQWPEALWTALEENGLTRALLPEEQDGSGLTLHEAIGVLRLAGYYAAPVPLAETWLAGHALATAGCEIPRSGLTVPSLALDGGGLGDHLHGVPWGRHLPVVRLITGPTRDQSRLQLVRHATVAREGSNMAGEPRDDIDLSAGETVEDTVIAWSVDYWLALAAVMRGAQMAGAVRRCLDLACSYAGERKQFGRPLAKFQAIQQQLALLAGEAAAVETAVETAAATLSPDAGLLDAAVAKARAGQAVDSATNIAHQVHGAMGFTYEHRLHHYSRRLWSWRDDFGPETYWNRIIAEQALQAGGDGLWPMLTALGRPALPRDRPYSPGRRAACSMPALSTRCRSKQS
ncbi:MAG: acyl-CoA dehydrogenase [Salinisphaeraceae bacterium]|nr:acyl-CoA dehydrogenase [Salinisphaeraceae bacterium]